jgi:acyl-CoA thioesterase-2
MTHDGRRGGSAGSLLDVLDLRPGAEPDTFVGDSLVVPHGRMFGGQVLAQAVLAAARTVDPARLPHSLHGYFLRRGDMSRRIDFAVERLRDGPVSSERRVHASQGDGPILSTVSSFSSFREQAPGPGPGPDGRAPSGVPGPDELPSAREELTAATHPSVWFWIEGAFDVRHVGGSLYVGPQPDRAGRQLVWMRFRGALPDGQLRHRALLAYACDQVMLEPVMRRGGLSWSSHGLTVASIDHAMWWHRDLRVDEWLLFVQDSPSGQGGRGLGTAQVFDPGGALVASIAQEGIVRVPGAPP